MPRGRPKGKKDNPAVKRNKLRYLKKYNPARARCHRPKGSPNKSDYSAFVQWCKSHCHPQSDRKIDPTTASKKDWWFFYHWLLDCVMGKRGRAYRSRQRMFVNSFLEEPLIGLDGWRYYSREAWTGKKIIRSFPTAEEGFKYIREQKKQRFLKMLSIRRKIKRLEKEIANEQTNQGSLRQLTNN